MRGARAKVLKAWALDHPHPTQTRWEGKTLIRGGVRRAYRKAKKQWRNTIAA